jgi:hypothetical protein
MHASQIFAHPLLRNVVRSYILLEPTTQAAASGPVVVSLVLALNARLIERHADLFADPSLFMRAPEEVVDGQTVTARTGIFATTWEFPPVTEPYPIDLVDGIDDDALNRCVDDIAREIKAELAYYSGPYRPYVPITTAGVTGSMFIHAGTMCPTVRFASQYDM